MYTLAAQSSGGSWALLIVVYAVIFGGFWFIDISDDDVIVEFGSNRNCRIPMQKAAIAQVEKASAE